MSHEKANPSRGGGAKPKGLPTGEVAGLPNSGGECQHREGTLRPNRKDRERMLPQITTSTLVRQVRSHFFLVVSVIASRVLASMVVVLATTKPAWATFPSQNGKRCCGSADER